MNRRIGRKVPAEVRRGEPRWRANRRRNVVCPNNGQTTAPAGRGTRIGLLPQQAPLLVGLQEIGGGEDIEAMARAAQARYKHSYRPLFVKGKDTATGQRWLTSCGASAI